MTRRERLERKLEKRQDWADGRRAKAGPLFDYADRYRGDIAFNTQPGHIPERARVIRKIDQGHAHLAMAAHHEQKAAGLEAQLERSVYSDDADAVEQLRARIAEREAERARMVLVNKLYRKRDAAGLAALGLDLERLTAELAKAGAWFGKQPHMPYELSNLAGRIRADKERIADVERRQARTERAEAAPGGVTIDGPTGPTCAAAVTPTYAPDAPPWICQRVAGHPDDHAPSSEWLRVTFADKPARAILEALKAAGFRWRGGSWSGPRAQLPAAVLELTRTTNTEDC